MFMSTDGLHGKKTETLKKQDISFCLPWFLLSTYTQTQYFLELSHLWLTKQRYDYYSEQQPVEIRNWIAVSLQMVILIYIYYTSVYIYSIYILYIRIYIIYIYMYREYIYIVLWVSPWDLPKNRLAAFASGQHFALPRRPAAGRPPWGRDFLPIVMW